MGTGDTFFIYEEACPSAVTVRDAHLQAANILHRLLEDTKQPGNLQANGGGRCRRSERVNKGRRPQTRGQVSSLLAESGMLTRKQGVGGQGSEEKVLRRGATPSKRAWKKRKKEGGAGVVSKAAREIGS